MPTPILITKLYIPPPRSEIVLRPRLLERLNEGLRRNLSLISAPAGFGKTTLVSEWVASCEWPAAWLSLDERDNDPVRFLTYLIAALQTIAPSIGEGVSGALQSSRLPPTESVLTALLNEITTILDNFILVLDDYHVIDSQPVDHALTFLLEHLPPQMHLVIATREDPPLSLARLRARGQLTELRVVDLRFTSAEAADFLTEVMSLNLLAEHIAALADRTEGWIAGLQLAALSLRGREDIPKFIRAFAGDNRYIVDYLVEEVLERQPEAVRRFLLQTAILDRLSGSLCDAVTGQEGGNARLEALERGNFFVVSLDDNRHWYRYHHLFAEVLAARLRAEQPDRVTALHRRASLWYEQHGIAADAIRHALAAEDFERAADLIERAVPAIRRSRQEATLLGWLQALPDGLFCCRPVLSVHYVGTLLQSGQLDGVEARLRDAERWLDTNTAMREQPGAAVGEMIVVDEEEFRRLPSSIAMYHAGLALALGNVPTTVKYARRVLDLASEEEHFQRGAASALLGLAAWTSGDLEVAHQSYAEGMAHLLKAGYISDAVGGAIALADIRLVQGRLREAMRTYEHALQLATQQGDPLMRGTADMYVGISELYRERNDLHTAIQYLLKSKEQGEHTGFPQNRYRWRVAMARIKEAQGDLDGALELLDEAEHMYVSDFHPNVRPIGAMKARLWVAQGRLSEALDWAQDRGLALHDDLRYLCEFEYVTLARVLLAQFKNDQVDDCIHEAGELLERLLKAAVEGKRTGSVIAILVLKGLAHQAQGNIPAALESLERALTLAEPEGYIRIFTDEGPSMAALLREVAKRGSVPNYIRQLRTAFGQAAANEKAGGRAPDTRLMIEPLSEREFQVLRLLRTDLNGPGMARQLSVSLNTLHTHTRNIYSKLGVNNRRAAVRRAEDLDLF